MTRRSLRVVVGGVAAHEFAPLIAAIAFDEGGHVDDYSEAKEPFISAALDRAEHWASGTGWEW